MSRLNTVLSIDFDFFIQEKQEFDWGHRESSLFINTIWPIRAMQLLSQGIDPLKEVGVKGRPVDLSDDLQGLGWKFKRDLHVHVAESHASAYHALKTQDNLEIINIDAHHDLLYDQAGRLECGNWIYMLAKEGRVKKVTIVYPHWRKEEEGGNPDFPSDETLSKFKELNVPVEIVYGIGAVSPRKVDSVFIARSGAWVPPWTDDEFLTFAFTWITMGNAHTIWGYKALEEFRRNFNLKDAAAGADVMRQQMEEMKKALKK